MLERIRSQRAASPAGERRDSGSIIRFGAVAAFCAGADLLLPTPLSLETAALIYLCFSTWLSWAEGRRAALILNPVVCYQAWQTATLGLAPLYIAFAYGAEDFVPFGNWPVPMSRVAYGHAIMTAGSWAFYAGMKHFQPRELAGDRRPMTATRTLLISFVLGVAFLVGREVVTQFAGSVVAQLSFLPLAVLCMVALNPPKPLRKSESAQGLVLLGGVACVLFLNARRDSKMEMMFSFVPLVWWLLRRRKIAMILVAGPALAALYLIGIAPLVTAMRNSGVRTETGSVAIITPDVTDQAVQQLREKYSSNPLDYVGQWTDMTMSRLCDPVAAGMVVWITDQQGFLNGRGFDYVPVTLIPRALWRDKPFIDRGREFTAILGWAADASVATTSTGQTAAGELFWNLGWPGVIAGMYVLGAAVAGFWWRSAGVDPRRGLLEMTAYVGAMLSFVLGSGAAAGPVFVGCITAGLFFRVMFRLRQWLFPWKATRHDLRVGRPHRPAIG